MRERREFERSLRSFAVQGMGVRQHSDDAAGSAAAGAAAAAAAAPSAAAAAAAAAGTGDNAAAPVSEPAAGAAAGTRDLGDAPSGAAAVPSSAAAMPSGAAAMPSGAAAMPSGAAAMPSIDPATGSAAVPTQFTGGDTGVPYGHDGVFDEPFDAAAARRIVDLLDKQWHRTRERSDGDAAAKDGADGEAAPSNDVCKHAACARQSACIVRELEKLHDNYRSSDDKHKNFQMKARTLWSGADRHGVHRQ
jgi:hypothetical protein